MTASIDHVNQDLVIQLVPQNNREGLPERDLAGHLIENIGNREFVLKPGAPVCFRRVARGESPAPGSDNLATFNRVVMPLHAEVRTGPSDTSIWLMDFGCNSVTYVDHNKYQLDPPVGDEGTNFEKVPEIEPVRVDNGAYIRLGSKMISQNGKIIWPAPSWRIFIRPLNPQAEGQWRDAADKPNPARGDLRSRFARLGL